MDIPFLRIRPSIGSAFLIWAVMVLKLPPCIKCLPLPSISPSAHPKPKKYSPSSPTLPSPTAAKPKCWCGSITKTTREWPPDGPKQKSALDVPIFVIYRDLSEPSRRLSLQMLISRQPLRFIVLLQPKSKLLFGKQVRENRTTQRPL